MNVSLTPELEQFIQSQIESGKYASATEVIVDALKVFAAGKHLNKGQAEASMQVKTPEELGKHLESLLIEGLDSGEAIEVTDEWWEQKRAKLVEQMHQRQPLG